MLKEHPSALERDELPEVEVKKRRGISLVWLIPLVAGAIAIWLAYTTLQEKGPKITVMFDNAEGLEAGKTRVKYRNVEVGLVDEVALSEDLSHIVVTASLDKTMEPHMKEGTRFWIVRPRVGFGGVSGLGTLLSGAYVEFDPGEGQPAHDFVGLAEPPPITSQVPGTQFVLRTDRLGGIGRGAPVYYRSIRGRSGARLRAGGGQAGPDRQSLRRRPERSAGAAEQPVLERERRQRVARCRRRRCRDGVAGGVARRRHRVRHAGHRPAGRAGRCRYGSSRCSPVCAP